MCEKILDFKNYSQKFLFMIEFYCINVIVLKVEVLIMDFVTLKSYDGKIVRVPEERKDEYLRNQERIKMYLSEGKTTEEIKEILKEE